MKLAGEIPTEVGHLSALTILLVFCICRHVAPSLTGRSALRNNRLVGTIPTELRHLSALTSLLVFCVLLFYILLRIIV